MERILGTVVVMLTLFTLGNIRGVACVTPIQIKRSIIEEFLADKDDKITYAKPEEELKELREKEKITREKLKLQQQHAHKLDYKRIKLPVFENMVVGHERDVILPGDIEARVKVLSTSPLIFEVDNFLEDEDCDLLIDMAKAKKMKPLTNKIADVRLKHVEQTFKEWDYDQNGVITMNEIVLLPALSGIKFTEQDADDMFFLLKMDKDKNGEITLDELRHTDFAKIKQYFTRVREENVRQRNISSQGAWVWHDSDELLKYAEEGYFESYHERISFLTGIPKEIVEESEPLQVRHFAQGQFQTARHDSEPDTKDIPCCLYGDAGKVCRLCRYISLSVFLSDVEDGGELVFPLANTSYQHVVNNSGEWRGYFIYAKTTGNKFYFKMDMQFKIDGVNRIFEASGKDESGDFSVHHGIIIDDAIKFEKSYNSGSNSNIKYHGKLVDGTKITGYWWLPGNKRLRGSFFMWNRNYDIFSSTAIDQSNTITGCAQSSLVIKPKKGKAIFWQNHEINPKDGMVGELNQESIYAQCEVKTGHKWIASSWLNIIGDGDLSLRAWRRGNNFLTDYNAKLNIFKELGTNEDKLPHEAYESEYLEERLGTNHTSGENLDGYYKHKPASNALQALNLLFNDMTTEQLQLIAGTVHKKLGMTCVPLSV